MFKKVMLVCLVLTLVFFATPVVAEGPFSFANNAAERPGAGGQAPAFVYRDGVMFGMTVEQVKALEKNKPAEEKWETNFGTNSDWYFVRYMKEKTGDLSCDIKYYFTGSKGALVMIQADLYYTFMTDFNYDKLQNEFSEIDYALAEKYGAADVFKDITVLLTGAAKQYSYWNANSERSVDIEHSLLTGGANILHSIKYILVETATPGPI